jgi:hypothetical protein
VSAPADPLSSYRAIENLIAAYAELVDDGDFAGLGRLLADTTFTGSGPPITSTRQNWSWIYPSDWTLSTGPIPVRLEVHP